MITRYRVGHRADGDDPEGPLRFVLATEGLKADGIDLRMANLDLARYRANPVIQPAHDWRAWPIGRGENIEVDGDRLMADAVFDLEDDVGAEVDRKYRRQFLNAVSVGFDLDGLDEETGIPDRWELLEFSAVTIPLDGDALVESGRQRAAALTEALTGLREGDVESTRDRKLLETALGALTALLEERSQGSPVRQPDPEPDPEPDPDPEAPQGHAARERRLRLLEHEMAISAD